MHARYPLALCAIRQAGMLFGRTMPACVAPGSLDGLSLAGVTTGIEDNSPDQDEDECDDSDEDEEEEEDDEYE